MEYQVTWQATASSGINISNFVDWMSLLYLSTYIFSEATSWDAGLFPIDDAGKIPNWVLLEL